jgi:hypothetical protein
VLHFLQFMRIEKHRSAYCVRRRNRTLSAVGKFPGNQAGADRLRLHDAWLGGHLVLARAARSFLNWSHPAKKPHLSISESHGRKRPSQGGY